MKGIIRLSSVTYAMRAQRILDQNGIRSHIRKITHDNGCSYVLEINADPESAVKIIQSAGIRVL